MIIQDRKSEVEFDRIIQRDFKSFKNSDLVKNIFNLYNDYTKDIFIHDKINYKLNFKQHLLKNIDDLNKEFKDFLNKEYDFIWDLV